MYIQRCHYNNIICDWIWENPTFCRFYRNRDFATFNIYNVWVTSLLSMSIYNCTVSELQRFVTLILRVIKIVHAHLTIVKIIHWFSQTHSHNTCIFLGDHFLVLKYIMLWWNDYYLKVCQNYSIPKFWSCLFYYKQYKQKYGFFKKGSFLSQESSYCLFDDIIIWTTSKSLISLFINARNFTLTLN